LQVAFRLSSNPPATFSRSASDSSWATGTVVSTVSGVSATAFFIISAMTVLLGSAFARRAAAGRQKLLNQPPGDGDVPHKGNDDADQKTANFLVFPNPSPANPPRASAGTPTGRVPPPTWSRRHAQTIQSAR